MTYIIIIIIITIIIIIKCKNAWHDMWIICLEDDSHKVQSLIFSST